jgi:hypothetical protein
MQAHFTTRLIDALFAGFDRCAEHGQPLSQEQQRDMLSAAFESFADKLYDSLRRNDA